MKKLRAFLNGVFESRHDTTTHYDYPLIETYDRGRSLGRRILLLP